MTARAGIALASGSVAIGLLVGVPTVHAQDVGEARLTPQEGGSSTEFVVRLPAGAECPGDSADDGYRVNSYMVPASVDPTTIVYDGLGPTPFAYGDYATFREPLFDVDTNSFASGQTADAELPGQPGPIVDLPTFSFAVYEPGDLPAGRYHLGIACTLLNEVVRVWDTEVEVTDASDDAPSQIRWRVVGVDPAGAPGLPTAALAAAGAAIVVLVVRRRHQPKRTAAPMEDS